MDRETLNACVDGELQPEEMARIAALLEAQPDMKAYVQKQERLCAALGFEEVMRAPPPTKLVETARNAPVSWRWRLQAVLGRGFVWRSLVPAGAALVTGLIVGMVSKPAENLILSHGQMLAHGRLAQAL